MPNKKVVQNFNKLADPSRLSEVFPSSVKDLSAYGKKVTALRNIVKNAGTEHLAFKKAREKVILEKSPCESELKSFLSTLSGSITMIQHIESFLEGIAHYGSDLLNESEQAYRKSTEHVTALEEMYKNCKNISEEDAPNAVKAEIAFKAYIKAYNNAQKDFDIANNAIATLQLYEDLTTHDGGYAAILSKIANQLKQIKTEVVKIHNSIDVEDIKNQIEIEKSKLP